MSERERPTNINQLKKFFNEKNSITNLLTFLEPKRSLVALLVVSPI